MKSKSTAAEKPLTMVEQLLQKREGLVSERDGVLAKLMELNVGIESLDSVITMFDPKHVPLDIRMAAQTAPLLTLQAQPVLSEVVAQAASAAPEAKAPAKADAKGAKADQKPGRQAKAAAASNAEPVKPAAKAESAIGDAIADQAKLKARHEDKKKKKLAAARDVVKDYFGDIDKLKTLEDIVKSSADGVPFREICEKFAERHPIDTSKPEIKKVFSDRLSALLWGLSQQSIVQRGERQGETGKENVWLHTRAPKNGNGGHAATGAEASAAV
ncbi:hypothetical protein OIU34_22720 [Pararhizobium sp. BT-229]|uniref:hypothetical protein n=1 Tax=Pararhizobium sp. BT-229 TaxID=2986923 RepID=UPI0021F79EF9|nr:hypothetical protein [Pararhizobium sp. BT-229]MCV9964708.1 hypothetical protein [Pararhizobium sp. BT-229]